MLNFQGILRATSIASCFIAVAFTQHYNYYQENEVDTGGYPYHYYGYQNQEDAHYPYYDNPTTSRTEADIKQYFYGNHNLTGYPEHYPERREDNDGHQQYDYDYYQYDYQPEVAEPRPEKPNGSGLVIPHPGLQRFLKFLNGLQDRQFGLGGLFSGNTIYLTFAVALGVVGVGGLVYQFAQGVIDDYQKQIDDLKSRVTALESSSSTSTSSGTSAAVTSAISTLQTDLAALTTKHTTTCNKVNEITMVAKGAGAEPAITQTYADDLVAIVDIASCT